MKVVESLFKLLFKLFEDFIKRSVVPSISFGFIFFVEYFIFKEIYKIKIEEVNKLIPVINLNNLTILFLIILVIGFSYFLSILHQLLFDNYIKKNYNGWFSTYENDQLKVLREKVINKLKVKLIFIDTKYSDYILYQAIGRELSYFRKPTSTTRYVDDTKAIGIFFISIMVTNIIFTIIGLLHISICILIIVISYIIAYFAIKAKYRSRALRIYINYLIDEKDEQENTNPDI